MQAQQQNAHATESLATKAKSSEQDWQFVIPVPVMKTTEVDTEMSDFDLFKDDSASSGIDQEATHSSNGTDVNQASGIFPAARARLASLRDLGAKKIGALKLKLIENKIKSNERGKKNH